MKKVKQILMLALTATILSIGCKKSDESSNVSTGTFTVNGVTYSGPCVGTASTTGCTTNSNVGIAGAGGNTNFLIYNIPNASSGTTNFQAFSQTGCNNFAGYTVSTTTIALSSSGTITKTGAKSFTFSCVCKDISTNQAYTISGSGSY